MSRADHVEQRVGHGLVVDDELRVEDLVPAMLGVGLRKHHELDIRRVASELLERLDQVADLIVRERKAELGVGARERRVPVRTERHPPQRTRCTAAKEVRLVLRDPERLGHSIMQQRPERAQLGLRKRLHRLDVVGRAALDPPYRLEAADEDDIGGLAGPGRDRPEPRCDEQPLSTLLLELRARAIGQKLSEHLELGFIEVARGIHEVHQARGERTNARIDALQRPQQSFEAKLRQRGCAGHGKHAEFYQKPGRRNFDANAAAPRESGRPPDYLRAFESPPGV